MKIQTYFLVHAVIRALALAIIFAINNKNNKQV